MAFVVAVAVSFGCLSNDAVFGVSPESTPTSGPRRVHVVKRAHEVWGPFVITPRGAAADDVGGCPQTALMIDGNRNGRYVLFDHEAHLGRAKGASECCSRCHHMNKPLDSATSCHECHSDMYLDVDLFDHSSHEAALHDNQGCARCHSGAESRKVRANTPACASCHPNMRPADTRVVVADPDAMDHPSGYMAAMHGLCITCHEEQKTALEVDTEGLAECATCHGDLPGLGEAVWETWR
jgi:hypothetical protein